MSGQSWVVKLFLVAAVLVVAALALFFAVGEDWGRFAQIAILGVLAVILGSVVPLVSLQHRNAATRQLDRFASIAGKPLGRTAYAKIAEQYFSNIANERLLAKPGFSVAAGFLTILVSLSALAALFGAQFDALLKTPNLFLGGLNDTTDEAARKAYQGATLLMVSMAGLGAYVIVVLRLIKRINNFDIDPISFYFLSFHIIQAVVVAAVIRHLLSELDIGQTTSMLVGLGFAIGLQPDIFMSFVARWAREKLSIATSPAQSGPQQDHLPTNLSLSMLEGMTKEKRARFEEMGIDNSQALAEYNPYVLWARTAFQMQQILDWIAQAQLYVLVKEDLLKKLRPYGIREIFGFDVAAQGTAKPALATLLGVPVEVLDAIVKNLHRESSYTRLLEVREVLIPRVPEAGPENGPVSEPEGGPA